MRRGERRRRRLVYHTIPDRVYVFGEEATVDDNTVYLYSGPKYEADTPVGTVEQVTKLMRELVRSRVAGCSDVGIYSASIDAEEAAQLLIVGFLLHADLDKGELQGDLYQENPWAVLQVGVPAERFGLSGGMLLTIVPSSGYLWRCYRNDVSLRGLPS